MHMQACKRKKYQENHKYGRQKRGKSTCWNWLEIRNMKLMRCRRKYYAHSIFRYSGRIPGYRSLALRMSASVTCFTLFLSLLPLLVSSFFSFLYFSSFVCSFLSFPFTFFAFLSFFSFILFFFSLFLISI